MINFFYETDFILDSEPNYIHWLNRVVDSEAFSVGEINYIFCDDEYLLKVNQQYLNHDTYTDIITFDYREGDIISGDILISVERVRENANSFKGCFKTELLRVMAHGLLHIMDYNDKMEEDIKMMRSKEEEKIKLFHVEQM
ncbi:rRNA maturation RNase YbeY [Maribacter sp. ANRC-HE7]|uniref:Endoribonuclease YbeY n=1 Tax=Maribacter aquimaris TaxID=2737171 RepID=A0ABR7V8X1_9FLAO|nr:rRNA maturation RNase YbeY [Maribacter aquimaris]MBD0779721.1 rRNA maturation RNase YbeY [Maribacter aquimaris]